VIEALSVQYAIKQCCEALRVSRSGFYQRQKAAESRRAAQEAELVKEIKSIYQANKRPIRQSAGEPDFARQREALWQESGGTPDAQRGLEGTA
jgi:hypothetical protein